MPKELESAIEMENDADNQTIPMEELSETEGAGREGEGEENTEPTPVPVPKKAKPYTPEEIEELVKSDKDVDTSRLTLEGTALMKTFQRGYTPKLQKLAEERRQFEEERRRYQEPQHQQGQPKNAEQGYFELYMADPLRVTAEINAEIQNLAHGTPYDEGWEGNQSKIEQLRGLKETFAIRRQQTIEMYNRSQNAQQEFSGAVYKEMPDFETRREKLLEHAKGLGISEETAYALTNPSIVGGVVALEALRVINKLYSATIGVESKRKKPTPLQPGGARASGEGAEEDMEKVPIGTYMTRRKQKS